MNTELSIIIPAPTQLALDDTGWFCPTDARKTHGPSRTGMPRYHVAEDYEAIEALGASVGMEINCGFVIGEWDMLNVLSRLPNFSQYGDKWDNASHRDPKELNKCVEVINSSPHIGFAIHGLLHGYYMDGTDNHDTSDYYYYLNRHLKRVPEDEIRARLDSFLALVRQSGITKTINTFIPPSFVYRRDDLSRILADYNIKVVSTIFATMWAAGSETVKDSTIHEESYVFMENGIAVTDRHTNPYPWDRCECSFDELPPIPGVVGLHWPNILHRDVERNGEVVERAASWLKRSRESYGIVISNSMLSCAAQSLFLRYGIVQQTETGATFDLSAVPKSFDFNEAALIISSRTPLTQFEDCVLEDTEEHEDFLNYRIKPISEQFSVSR